MSVGASHEWGRRTLEFVDAVGRLTAPDVIAKFEEQIAACGFHAYIMAGLPALGSSMADLTIANGWPEAWFKIYEQENFSQVDPVPRHGYSTVQPFEWSEAVYDRDKEPRAHQVMTWAAEFGLKRGYCIPLHYDDDGAIISMAGSDPDLDSVSKSALQLISIYAHNRIRALNRPTVQRRGLLTPREREILRWAAEGKTAWEISVILDLSERTVKFHLIEASRKLNAVNRTAAVAKALAWGLIKL
jgi:LuxR family quorum sensing-dependent transcriptional regulator